MNRRSFLWQGICSSLPLFTRASISQQVPALPVSKPSDSDLPAFTHGLTGKVFRPGDPKYEQLRKGYAAKFAGHPALVVQRANLQDIQASLSFARSNNLPLAVRCRGHSYAGYSTCDGGLVLDMSGFRNLTIASDKSHAREPMTGSSLSRTHHDSRYQRCTQTPGSDSSGCGRTTVRDPQPSVERRKADSCAGDVKVRKGAPPWRTLALRSLLTLE